MQNTSHPEEAELRWHEQAFIAIEYLQSPELLAELQTLSKRDLEIIFTSKHAVLSVFNLLKAFPDQWTANMLEGATLTTFDRVFPGARRQARGYYAEELAMSITSRKPEKPFAFFCGDKRRNTLPDQLQRHNLVWQQVIVYQTVLQPAILEQHYDGIVFFSPSAVESYFKNNQPDPASVLFAIGSTTATAIKPHWEGPIICPRFPDKTEMHHTVQNYFNTLL